MFSQPLSEHRFLLNKVSTCFERERGGLTQVVGLLFHVIEDSNLASRGELRVSFGVLSQSLAGWREGQRMRDPRLPLGIGTTVASVDARLLAHPPEWLGWNLMNMPDAWGGLALDVIRYLRTTRLRYLDQFEDFANLDREIPGLKLWDAIEFCLSRNRRDVAAGIVGSFLGRTDSLGPVLPTAVECVRRNHSLPQGITHELRRLALAIALYDLPHGE